MFQSLECFCHCAICKKHAILKHTKDTTRAPSLFFVLLFICVCILRLKQQKQYSQRKAPTPEKPRKQRVIIVLKHHNTTTKGVKNTMKKAKITRLYEIRRLNGLSQEAAAELFGVSKSYYIKIETGYCKAGRGFIERFRELYPNEDINIFFAA